MNKKELRKEYIVKRNSLLNSDKIILEKLIINRILENFAFSNKITSCFLPILSKNELDTWDLIRAIRDKHGKIALTKWDDKSHLLAHRIYNEDTIIETNSYGIPEPINGETISDNQLDFILVPLLIADIKGNRVGYGKGVYDRFLSTCVVKTKFIGISFFELVDEIEDIDKNDIPLHYCVTPTKMYCFEK